METAFIRFKYLIQVISLQLTYKSLTALALILGISEPLPFAQQGKLTYFTLQLTNLLSYTRHELIDPITFFDISYQLNTYLNTYQHQRFPIEVTNLTLDLQYYHHVLLSYAGGQRLLGYAILKSRLENVVIGEMTHQNARSCRAQPCNTIVDVIEKASVID